MVNHVKRKSLKTIASAAAGVAAASQIPLTFADDVSNSDNAGLLISHIETVFGQTIFVENLSDETVRLESINPGYIPTSSGKLDVNCLLINGALEIQPATTQAHNISNDGRLHNWAVWKTIESTSQPLVTTGRVRPVNVHLHDQTLSGAPRRFVQTGYFA